MTVNIDIPTREQFSRLLRHRAPSSVSIYLPTSRLPQQAAGDRVVLSNLGTAAVDQLRTAGADAADLRSIDEAISDLVADDEFWARQADSLAVFVTPATLQTFRVPNRLTEAVEISDRFHVKPLLRSATFPQAAYVLALAKGGVRLLEIGPDGPPEEVLVPELPRDAWDPRANKVFKARDRNYVRQIDHALRGIINGSDLPLVIAATEGIAALYRTVNTYPHLVEARWPGNPEEASDAELASNVRTVLDDLYAQELKGIAGLFDDRSSQGRSALDVSDVARLATRGAVDLVLVDIDASLPGSIDNATGAVTFSATPGVDSHGLIDEIARRVHLSGGRVMAVRANDIPGGGPVAAILRFVP
jgi:hypothetical protein